MYKRGFKIDAQQVKELRELKQCGLQEAARQVRKEEALRRIDNIINWPHLREFLRDLVENVM